MLQEKEELQNLQKEVNALKINTKNIKTQLKKLLVKKKQLQLIMRVLRKKNI